MGCATFQELFNESHDCELGIFSQDMSNWNLQSLHFPFLFCIVRSRMRMNRICSTSLDSRLNPININLTLKMHNYYARCAVRFGHSFNSIVSIYRFYFWSEWLMGQTDCVKHKTFMTLWLHDGFRFTCDCHESSRVGDDRRQSRQTAVNAWNWNVWYSPLYLAFEFIDRRYAA